MECLKTLTRQTYENGVIVAYEQWDDRRARVYNDFLNTKRLALIPEEVNERRRAEELSRADNILQAELKLAWDIYEKSESGSMFHSILIKAERIEAGGWVLKTDKGQYLANCSPSNSRTKLYNQCGELLKGCGHYNHKFRVGWRLFCSDSDLPLSIFTDTEPLTLSAAGGNIPVRTRADTGSRSREV